VRIESVSCDCEERGRGLRQALQRPTPLYDTVAPSCLLLRLMKDQRNRGRAIMTLKAIIVDSRERRTGEILLSTSAFRPPHTPRLGADKRTITVQ
jgi:hypothetical protein